MRAHVNGIDMYYEVHGAGRPLLFVHGFPLSGRMWMPAVERLKSSHRCIVPDLRGLGRSSATESAGMKAYADDLTALLDEMAEVRPVVLVGLSMGGYIAFEFFRRHRDRLRALVLADTRANDDPPDAKAKREDMAKAVAEKGSKVAADAMIDKLFAPGVNPSLRQEWHDIMTSIPPTGVIAAIRAMADRPDSRPTLDGIDLPTLLAVGEHDGITPPDVHREMQAAIAGSRLEVVSGAGHMMPLERSEEFCRLMTDFIAKLG